MYILANNDTLWYYLRMSTLKLKAAIYRKTGIYLAKSEELDYLKSEKFWLDFCDIVKHEEDGTKLQDIQSSMIGLWRCVHGFIRRKGFK